MERRQEGLYRPNQESDPNDYKGVLNSLKADPVTKKPGKVISTEDLEAEMFAAVKETERAASESKSKHSWFRSGSTNENSAKKPEVNEYGSKSNVVIPGMKDIGKVGAEAPSYTQLFAAKQKQRQKGKGGNTSAGPKQEDLSPAAAMFAPDEVFVDNGSVAPSYTQLFAAQQKQRQGGNQPQDEDSDSDEELYGQKGPGGRNGLPPLVAHSSGTTPVPASSKEEGVIAWLNQVPPHQESDEDVPTATPVPVQEQRYGDIGSVSKNSYASLATVVQGHAEVTDTGINSIVQSRSKKQGKGMYTEKFDQISEGGNMPPFPSNKAEPAPQKPAADNMEPLPSFFNKPKAATTNMKYTDQFNKGNVPTFPTNKEAPRQKITTVEEEVTPTSRCDCSIL